MCLYWTLFHGNHSRTEATLNARPRQCAPRDDLGGRFPAFLLLKELFNRRWPFLLTLLFFLQTRVLSFPLTHPFIASPGMSASTSTRLVWP